MLNPKYDKIINELTPFVISYNDNLSHLNFNYWNYTKESFHILNPLSSGTKDFWDMVRAVDAISFGPTGMGMDNWVMFDCGAMPSAIVGFCIDASLLNKSILNKLGKDESYVGKVPVSFYVAIPTINGAYFGHNLSSLNSSLGNRYPGLVTLTGACSRLSTSEHSSNCYSRGLRLSDVETNVIKVITTSCSNLGSYTSRATCFKAGVNAAESTGQRVKIYVKGCYNMSSSQQASTCFARGLAAI